MKRVTLRDCTNAIAWNVAQFFIFNLHSIRGVELVLDGHRTVIAVVTLVAAVQHADFHNAWEGIQAIAIVFAWAHDAVNLAHDLWRWWHKRRQD